MNKITSSKVLLLGGIFVIAFLLGLAGFKLGYTPSDNDLVHIGGDGSGLPPTPPQGGGDTIIHGPKHEPKLDSIKLRATTPKLSGDTTYSFKASCSGVPAGESITYELWNTKRRVQTSLNGSFNNIPGIAGGRYKLCLVGANKTLATISVRGFKLPLPGGVPNGGKDTLKEKPKKMLITKSEFQTKLLNQNDNSLKMARKANDKKSVLASNFSIKVVGMKSDEKKAPSDIEGVREKIHFEIWKSATVVGDLVYDEASGQVIQATIQPVY